MNTKILLTIIALGFLAACSKDKYTSKPQLKFKSVNTKVLSRGQQITFTLEVTDAEGDLQDTIWVQESVKNCSQSGGTAPYRMPDFAATKNLKGDIQICYSYGINLGCPDIFEPKCNGRNDSAIYRFWLQDKAKNKSDTAKSDEIVILQ
ncbi:MAG: hypothetical protein JWQ09_521 [Segetibacter sp.]|nr:hypothetical protein [Segetibacter sp.]